MISSRLVTFVCEERSAATHSKIVSLEETAISILIPQYAALLVFIWRAAPREIQTFCYLSGQVDKDNLCKYKMFTQNIL